MPVTSHDLIQAALEARRQAYAPYSHFPVGAALAAGDRLFVGCNVENASYGLTMCAERVAVGNAIVAGARDFHSIHIATVGGVPPCGACRQVLSEVAPQLAVFLIDVERDNQVTELALKNLLPMRFSPDDLPHQ